MVRALESLAPGILLRLGSLTMASCRAQEQSQGSRPHTKTKRGDSKKVGCLASFTVTWPHGTDDDDPSAIATVSWTEDHAQHTGHTSSAAASLSPDLRAFVEDELRAGLTPKCIQHKFRAQLLSRHRTLDMMEQSAPQEWRDYNVSLKDIRNMSNSMGGHSWRLADDAAQSLELFATSHPDDVLHYQPQIAAADQPFAIVIATPQQRSWLHRHS